MVGFQKLDRSSISESIKKGVADSEYELDSGLFEDLSKPAKEHIRCSGTPCQRYRHLLIIK